MLGFQGFLGTTPLWIGYGLAQPPQLIPKSRKSDGQPGDAPPAAESQLGTEGIWSCGAGVRKHRLGIELGLAGWGCMGLALYGDI